MANFLSITPAARMLRCPSCKATISASVQQCPYCSTAVDLNEVEPAADADFVIVNQGSDEAGRLKIAAIVMAVLLGLALFATPFGHKTADVNAKAKNGATPSGLAQAHKHKEAVDLLRRYGGHE
jgi:hypothetical protein